VQNSWGQETLGHKPWFSFCVKSLVWVLVGPKKALFVYFWQSLALGGYPIAFLSLYVNRYLTFGVGSSSYLSETAYLGIWVLNWEKQVKHQKAS